MTTKPDVIRELGEESLLLPAAVGRSLTANERVKYCFSLLQMAWQQACNPRGDPPTLRAEREASGVDDGSLDGVVAGSRLTDDGLVIPQAQRIHRMIVEGVEEMAVPLAMPAAIDAVPGSAPIYYERLRTLLGGLAMPDGERVPLDYVAAVTRVSEEGGDSIHRLVMDLHRELNRLQRFLSQESIAGASVYGLGEGDRPLVEAFMAGVNRTAALKFDHPGLGTTATRSGPALLIQNDIGMTDAHVLVVRVQGLQCGVIHADPHLQRVRFFQSMLGAFPVKWADMHSRVARWSKEDEPYYQCTGRYLAPSDEELRRFLEHLGSRLVFLIDWNRARKRLRSFVEGPGCIQVLRWAAEQEVGHRAFLQLGGDRLIFEAIEHASPSPVRYGQRLDEVLGKEAVAEFLQFVLRVTSEGLQQRRSERFIRDEIRAELLGRFETLEHGLLALAGEHAVLVGELAGGVLQGVLAAPEAEEARRQGAKRAAAWERRADALVDRVRGLARRSPGAQVYPRLLAEADDVADNLEEAAFLLTLGSTGTGAGSYEGRLQALAALLVTGSREWVKCLESATHVRRGGAREDLQDFLEAVDRVVTVEHQSDDAQREVTVGLFATALDWRQLNLVLLVAQSLEQAADSLARSALTLRDHVLGEVMTS
jgi:hypothetical protein